MPRNLTIAGGLMTLIGVSLIAVQNYSRVGATTASSRSPRSTGAAPSAADESISPSLANAPVGGHQSLCTDCAISPGNLLTCTCPINVINATGLTNGNWRTSSLDYGTCAHGQVIVVAGYLSCL